MRFHGWFQGSSQELTQRTTKCERKTYKSQHPIKRLHHHTSIKKGYPGCSTNRHQSTIHERSIHDGSETISVMLSSAGSAKRFRGVEAPLYHSQLLLAVISAHHARATPPTAPQKTAVYPRIIPATGQFGTVSELKTSHTLHASLFEARGKMRQLQGYSPGMLVHDCECFR